MATCRKIVNWKKTFVIPNEARISADAEDLIHKLITDSAKRLNFEGIKKHPFFKGVNWDNLRSTPAAIVPKVCVFS